MSPRHRNKCVRPSLQLSLQLCYGVWGNRGSLLHMHRAAFYGEGTQILTVAVGSWYRAPFHQRLMLLFLYVYYQPLTIKSPCTPIYAYICLTEISLHASTEDFGRKYELWNLSFNFILNYFTFREVTACVACFKNEFITPHSCFHLLCNSSNPLLAHSRFRR